jgi:hypothetical protein
VANDKTDDSETRPADSVAAKRCVEKIALAQGPHLLAQYDIAAVASWIDGLDKQFGLVNRLPQSESALQIASPFSEHIKGD